VDENLPREVAEILTRAGFNADTVIDEGLAGASDDAVAAASVAERRIIITLDTDFGNIKAYPPDQLAGVIVLRPVTQDKLALISLMHRLLVVLTHRTPEQELWIVQPDRVRIRQAD
jgi:predicted nuclease of predicted toxin-antitoxin system